LSNQASTNETIQTENKKKKKRRKNKKKKKKKADEEEGGMNQVEGSSPDNNKNA
jgi:CelD/BcsL family acetyltransferase involved in cellulose biosynthesis